jgi:hypothetical protein
MFNFDGAYFFIIRMILNTQPTREINKLSKWCSERETLVVLNALAGACDDQSVLRSKRRIEQRAPDVKPCVLVADKPLTFNEVIAFALA